MAEDYPRAYMQYPFPAVFFTTRALAATDFLRWLVARLLASGLVSPHATLVNRLPPMTLVLVGVATTFVFRLRPGALAPGFRRRVVVLRVDVIEKRVLMIVIEISGRYPGLFFFIRFNNVCTSG